MKELLIYVNNNYKRMDYYSNRELTLSNPEQRVAKAIKKVFPDIPLISVTLENKKFTFYREVLDKDNPKKLISTLASRPNLKQYDFIYLLSHHEGDVVEERIIKLARKFRKGAHIFPIIDDGYSDDSTFQYIVYKKQFPMHTIWQPFVLIGTYLSEYEREKLFPIIKAKRTHFVRENYHHIPCLFSDARDSINIDEPSASNFGFYYFGTVLDISNEEQNLALAKKKFHHSSEKEARTDNYWNVLIKYSDKNIREKLEKIAEIRAIKEEIYIDMVTLIYDKEHIDEMIDEVRPLLDEGFVKELGITNISLDDLKSLVTKNVKIDAVMLDVDLKNLPYEYLDYLKEKDIVPIARFDIAQYKNEPIFTDLAKRKGAFLDYFRKRKDGCLIILLYLIEKGIAVNLKYNTNTSAYYSYMKWFTLTKEDVKEIDNYFSNLK